MHLQKMPMLMSEMVKEWKRKSFHLLAIIIPMGLYYAPHRWMVWALALFLIASIAGDIARFISPSFGMWVEQYFGGLLRPHERTTTRLTFTGMTYLALGSLLSVAFFPSQTAITGLTILVVSDTLAALVGKRYGTTKLTQTKTLAGTIAFTVSAWWVVLCMHWLVFPTNGWQWVVAGLLAAVVTALVELIPCTIIDDNVSIPLAFAIVCETAFSGLHHISG